MKIEGQAQRRANKPLYLQKQEGTLKASLPSKVTDTRAKSVSKNKGYARFKCSSIARIAKSCGFDFVKVGAIIAPIHLKGYEGC